MYGQFVGEIPETTDEKETWHWLRKADVKVETEAMLCKNSNANKIFETQDETPQ